MSKLNKTQKYAIQWLSHTGSDSDAIAKELNVTSTQVLSVIGTPSSKTETTARPQAKDLMITHTSGKKSNSVSIMTKEASEIGDASRNRHNNTKTNEQKGIFRPKK
jgi:hypothetical protein